jgi:hypothetical protein
MRTPFSTDGIIPLRAAPAALLKHVGRENDPVAMVQGRYRRLWAAAQKNPDLIVRAGDRLFVHNQPAKLQALAEAVGLVQPQRKPTRARRAPSNPEAAAAA